MDFMTQSVYLTDHTNGKRAKNKPHTPSSNSTLYRQIRQDRVFVANINRLHNVKYAGWVLKGEKNTTTKNPQQQKQNIHWKKYYMLVTALHIICHKCSDFSSHFKLTLETTNVFGSWKKWLTPHTASHVWAWLCLGNNRASACCPAHLGPAQSGTRFASHKPALEEAAQDTARYDHP